MTRAAILLFAYILFVFALFGCATVPTAAEISTALDRRLTMLADKPLSLRCQAVKDAVARCERAGLSSDCAWDERFDASTEETCWTIMACKSRGEAP